MCWVWRLISRTVRPPPDDVITVGMVDLEDNDRWIALGESRAWNWQQGCMLQWIPGSKTDVIWNDREGDRFVARIMNVKTREMRTIPHAIYTVSPDGRTGMSADFRRIQDMRPGYGYAGLPDPNADKLAPDDSGIWKVNLRTGDAKLVISVADMLKIPFWKGDITKNKHYFNHLLFSPDGSRFIFLNRWRINEFRETNPTTPFDTRMLTAHAGRQGYPRGGRFRLHLPYFIWRATKVTFSPGPVRKATATVSISLRTTAPYARGPRSAPMSWRATAIAPIFPAASGS